MYNEKCYLQKRGIAMTESERKHIIELQYQGFGYKKIAKLTGIPVNTVKSFCARHPVQIEELQEVRKTV